MIEELVKAPNTVAEWIKAAQDGLELSDAHIAQALGYEKPHVVANIKHGRIRLPITKVPQIAEVLQIEPARLLQMLLRETSPELLDAIETCYGPLLLTDAEARLIRSIRQAAGGRDTALMMFDKEAVVAMVVAAPCA